MYEEDEDDALVVENEIEADREAGVCEEFDEEVTAEEGELIVEVKVAMPLETDDEDEIIGAGVCVTATVDVSAEVFVAVEVGVVDA